MVVEEEIIAEETLAALVEERNGSGHGFVLGIMVGILAGAAAATLFAPTSGEEMRQRIADEASPILGHSEQPGSNESASQDSEPENPVDRMRSMLARVRTRVQEATEEGQQAAQEAEAQGQAQYEELTHQEERQA